MTAHLDIVTGPPGVDIGEAVAAIGGAIDDGLAIRVVNSVAPGDGHTSPDPFHGADATVRLRYLPSAWQDPQTNLGVLFTGPARVALTDDIHTMAALGLDPSHRLTVQSLAGALRYGYTYPTPIEVGNLGVHARDAVLRAGGRVLVEAGNGMTHLEAIAALRLPPWAPGIDQLTLWNVLDVRQMPEVHTPAGGVDAYRVARQVIDGLTALGGTVALDSVNVHANTVLLGLPGGQDDFDVLDEIYTRVGDGYLDDTFTSIDSVRDLVQRTRPTP